MSIQTEIPRAGELTGAGWHIEVIDRLDRVSKADWDGCAGTSNPTVSWDFLNACEVSNSAVAETGWLPQHILLKDASGAVLGAIPLYLKGHSQGEYVFDHGWADAFERAGGSYYPKLQSSVPFTPVTGPRLLIPGGAADVEQRREMLIAGLVEVGRRHEVSNLHVTFCAEAELPAFEQAGFLKRFGHQYHWHNHGYSSFNDFLSELSARKRKAIAKERRDVAQSSVEMRTLTGDDLKPEHWDAFWQFYQDTGARKWGTPYLTRHFFDQLHQTMKDRVALMFGFDDSKAVCGALNLVGTDAVYGRNWGCDSFYKNLHFEACYYQAIEFAIERGLSTVEAGAQGHHKLQRGYLPTLTYSVHKLYHPGFEAAIDDYLVRERTQVTEELKWMSQENPFKRDNSGVPLRG